MTTPFLTKPRIAAIIEALNIRLAGPIEGNIDRHDYERARDWALSVQTARAEGRRRVSSRPGNATAFKARETA